MKIELVFNTLTLNVRLRRAISLVSLDAIKSKIRNIIAHKSINVLHREEKTCEKKKLFASHKHDLQCYS